MNPAESMIQFERFEKSYGKVRALEPLDLRIARGESFALLGPNGSGKTSAIRAVVGLHAPSGGRILVDGFDVSKTPVEAKKRLAYVPQRVSMPDLLTVFEVLRVFAQLAGGSSDRVRTSLDLFDLGDVSNRRTQELSGGMLQRLGLAVAFLREAPLLVLDEPTVNLDPAGIERLETVLGGLKKKGTTILFSSHRLHTAIQLADRVGMLVSGRMISIEKVAEFKDAVSRQTAVRIVLRELLDSGRIKEVAQKAGAELTACNHNHICFKALPEKRLDVIRAIESAGAVIEEFHTEIPEWQTLMQEHFEMPGVEKK